MKLYTEEEILKFLERKVIFDSDDLDKLTPIKPLTDKEIHDASSKYYTDVTASFYFELGAKWMRDKIQGGNNEQQ